MNSAKQYGLAQSSTIEAMEAPNAVKPENEMEAVGIDRLRVITGKLVNHAGFGDKRIPITRNGEEVAALIGLRDLERLRELDKVVVGGPG